MSIINYWGIVFHCIPIDDSISHQSRSIFSSPKYCAKDISCTLSLCYRSKASISLIFLSINLATLISILKWSLTRILALDFSMSNAKMAPHSKYLILLNQVYASIPTFWIDSLKVGIRFALNFWAEVGYQSITLCFFSSSFVKFSIVLLHFWFLLMTFVQVWTGLDVTIWA